MKLSSMKLLIIINLVEKSKIWFAMLGPRHEKAECLLCVTLPSPSIHVFKHIFMTESEHRTMFGLRHEGGRRNKSSSR